MKNLVFFPQELPDPVNDAKWEDNVVNIKSTLILPAVTMSHTGNITCIGSNEAGVNSSTTHLLVVGKTHGQLN